MRTISLWSRVLWCGAVLAVLVFVVWLVHDSRVTEQVTPPEMQTSSRDVHDSGRGLSVAPQTEVPARPDAEQSADRVRIDGRVTAAGRPVASARVAVFPWSISTLLNSASST